MDQLNNSGGFTSVPVLKKFIIFWLLAALLLPSLLQAQSLRLLLPADGDKSLSQECPQLMEAFLKDLRDVLPDTPVTLDLPGTSAVQGTGESYQVHCRLEADQRSIEMKSSDAKTNYLFRYTKRAQGFEATDWLVFQRRQRAPLSLAPQAQGPIDGFALTPSMANAEKEPVYRPYYKKPWFWGLLAGALGAGIGVFMATQAHPSDRLSVEIQ